MDKAQELASRILIKSMSTGIGLLSSGAVIEAKISRLATCFFSARYKVSGFPIDCSNSK